MNSAIEIQTEPSGSCLLCQGRGLKLYENVPDMMFGSPGLWDYLRCLKCGLVWIEPKPRIAEQARLYRTYYTHDVVATGATFRRHADGIRGAKQARGILLRIQHVFRPP